jgi:pilus assembly protein Flp/PilA
MDRETNRLYGRVQIRPVGPILGGKEVITTMTYLASWLSTISRRDEGQGLAEYALILALIAIVAIIALTFLGTQISAILSYIGSVI